MVIVSSIVPQEMWTSCTDKYRQCHDYCTNVYGTAAQTGVYHSDYNSGLQRQQCSNWCIECGPRAIPARRATRSRP